MNMNKWISAMAMGMVLFSMSCKDDVEALVSKDQNEAITGQSVTEAYFNEAGDLSIKAFNAPTSNEIAGGRTRGTITVTVEGDTRFNGAVVTLTTNGSDPLNPEGTITIDFGDGQTDPRGVERKGIILVNYQGLRFVPGSKTITTFDGYEINGVKIEGTRTITTSSLTATPALSVSFLVVDVDGKATFTDQTTITRNATHTHTITFGNTPGATTWVVEGQASGETRAKAEYVFLIERPLVFKTECAFQGFAMPSEGEALFTVGSLPISLNYGGEGASCDNVVTVSINNASQDITVNN